MGFRYILDGMNAERVLIAAECIGDGRCFIERAVKYAGERVVFGRPIGAEPGRAVSDCAGVRRARGRRPHASPGGEHCSTPAKPCGAEANMAKLLASEASWQAANAAMDTHGGFGFAEEYDIERKFRETRLYMTAPVANNLVLSYVGEHVLGMPRSF